MPRAKGGAPGSPRSRSDSNPSGSPLRYRGRTSMPESVTRRSGRLSVTPRERTLREGTMDVADHRVEEYMRGLVARYDEDVLLDMEREGEERDFPIVGRFVG